MGMETMGTLTEDLDETDGQFWQTLPFSLAIT
jgi:hypothetical protein